MAKRKIKLTKSQYTERVTARDWCKRHGFEGFARWYDEELFERAYSGRLPDGAIEYSVISNNENTDE